MEGAGRVRARPGIMQQLRKRGRYRTTRVAATRPFIDTWYCDCSSFVERRDVHSLHQHEASNARGIPYGQNTTIDNKLFHVYSF